MAQKLPADFLKAAASYTQLRSEGAAPFHLVADFEASGPADLLGKGIYEETWYSPHQWRREIKLGSYHAFEIQNGRSRYLQQSQAYEPGRVLLLLKTMLPNSLMESRYAPFHAKEWRVTEIPFENQTFQRVSEGNKDYPATVRSIILNSAGPPVETQDGGIVTYYSSVKSFRNSPYPRSIVVRSLAKEILLTVAVQSVDIPAGKLEETLGLPGSPLNASETLMPLEPGGPVQAPEIIKFDEVLNPEDFRALEHDKGKDWIAYAIVLIVVDKSGMAREPVVLYTSIPAAAEVITSHLSNWRFKPANIEGQPCEMLISRTLTVNRKVGGNTGH